MKTSKITFNSRIPTEFIRSKMKEHTKYSRFVFLVLKVVVNIHLKPQSSDFKQMFTTLWQRHSTKLVVGVSIYTDQ